MSRVSQPVLPLVPAEARPIGPLAGLVTTGEGSVVFVAGQASFAFAAGDETARRLAAVQLVTTKIASQAAVAAAFGVSAVTVWRWQATTCPLPPSSVSPDWCMPTVSTA